MAYWKYQCHRSIQILQLYASPQRDASEAGGLGLFPVGHWLLPTKIRLLSSTLNMKTRACASITSLSKAVRRSSVTTERINGNRVRAYVRHKSQALHTSLCTAWGLFHEATSACKSQVTSACSHKLQHDGGFVRLR